MALAELQLLEQQIGELDQETATLLREHQDVVQRLAAVPGLGADSAQQIIAEVCQGSVFRHRQEPRLLGRNMPGRRIERRCEPQRTLSQGQPSNATHSPSSCQCRCQTQRKHLRDRLSSIGAPLGTQQNHWRNCASPLSVDLDNLAQWRSL
jgi:hypothetical protein